MRNALIGIIKSAFIGAIVAVMAAVAPAAGQNVQRIAAVVNDDAISVYDLVARLRMVILTTGVPDNNQTRNALAPQVLRTLIDESLQMQEAERLSIGVDSAEVQAALRNLEGQLNLPQGGIEQLLRRAEIPLSTLESQIRAQLAWSKVVGSRLRPTVRIGEEEIEGYLQQVSEHLDEPQYRIGEIFLTVDTPANEAAVRDRARQIVERIREGANFQALARQFSEAATAANGGDMGWVRLDQLSPEIAAQIPGMEAGQVAEPIRSTEGYHIMVLAAVRNAEGGAAVPSVSLQQVAIPFGPGDDEAARGSQVELARTVSDVVEGCEDLAQAGREMGAQVSQRLSGLKVPELSDMMRNAIDGLEVGEPSEPIIQERSVVVVMVCERSGDSRLPSHEEVQRILLSEKLELLSRRYLRDIRNAAFVDVRV